MLLFVGDRRRNERTPRKMVGNKTHRGGLPRGIRHGILRETESSRGLSASRQGCVAAGQSTGIHTATHHTSPRRSTRRFNQWKYENISLFPFPLSLTTLLIITTSSPDPGPEGRAARGDVAVSSPRVRRMKHGDHLSFAQTSLVLRGLCCEKMTNIRSCRKMK